MAEGNILIKMRSSGEAQNKLCKVDDNLKRVNMRNNVDETNENTERK